tara:strand:- start:555 stop:776 length:222 start_codon:yes stop_codon:yes gene_type:complete
MILVTLFILALFPEVLASTGGSYRVQQFSHLDNHHPQAQQSLLEGTSARAIGVQLNSREALAFLAAFIYSLSW